MNNTHEFYKSKLTPGYAALYALTLQGQRLETSLTAKLADQLGYIRSERVGADLLWNKHKRYGNDGTWARKKSAELAQQIFVDKSPESIDLGTWRSVEIECILPNQRAEEAFIKYCRLEGLAKRITIKDDGSLRANDDDVEHNHADCEGDCSCCNGECECSGSAYGREIVVTFKEGDIETLNKVCCQLNQVGATVNKTCGLHVHFDMRHLNLGQVKTLAKRVALTVPALRLMLPVSRQNNQYCATPINAIRKGNRYSFVNLLSYPKHGTLEIRGHSGTTDATKILNWIAIINKIMATKSQGLLVESVEGLIKTFDFSPDLASYIRVRAEKFRSNLGLSDDVTSDNSRQESFGAVLTMQHLQNTYNQVFVGPSNATNITQRGA